jgi:hypothetical protein
MLFLSSVKEIFLKFILFIMASLFFASLLASVAFAGSPKTCSNPQLSCQNTTSVSDLCCFNAPGGQLLQTQFWDTNPRFVFFLACTKQMLTHNAQYWYVTRSGLASSIAMTDDSQALPIRGPFTVYGQTTAMERMTPTATLLGPIQISVRFWSLMAKQTCFHT